MDAGGRATQEQLPRDSPSTNPSGSDLNSLGWPQRGEGMESLSNPHDPPFFPKPMKPMGFFCGGTIDEKSIGP